MIQTLINCKGEIDEPTTTIRDLNTSIVDRTGRQKIH